MVKEAVKDIYWVQDLAAPLVEIKIRRHHAGIAAPGETSSIGF